MLFDAANPDASTEKRTISIVAPQALLFLNHPFVFTQAQQPGRTAGRAAAGDDNARIERAYQLLFGRSARPEELEVCRGFLFRSGRPRPEARLAGPCPPFAMQ